MIHYFLDGKLDFDYRDSWERFAKMEHKHWHCGFTTLPKQYFYPYNWNEKYNDSCITEKTIGIHWWKHSWK